MNGTLDFNFKTISDPVHGAIGLSELEVKVLGTRAFQRLRNVKQLGLAHFVFPAADYSRFAHSIGVCHITGRTLESLRRNSGAEIPDEEIQRYRLAALLHDVGHYPFSHTMEDAGAEFYSGLKVQPKGQASQHPAAALEPTLPVFHNHERVSKEIVLSDDEIQRLLDDGGHPPEDVARIFTREAPPRFTNLVSSDLDADRIDYLLRTAHHTGLPYGSVDIDYLLSQLRLDSNERLCLREKAMRTAEHFLLCRYFDYQQVSYHKTVAGLEAVMVKVLGALLRSGEIDCSSQHVESLIAEGKWCRFDDIEVLQAVRKLESSDESHPDSRAEARSVLERRPPKLVLELEQIVSRDAHRALRDKKKMVREHISEWAGHFGIPVGHWYQWAKDRALTRIGSTIPVADPEQPPDYEDAVDQAIRIMDEYGSSKPIMSVGNSLMKVLSDHILEAYRVYVLLPEGHDHLQMEIRNHIATYLEL